MGKIGKVISSFILIIALIFSGLSTFISPNSIDGDSFPLEKIIAQNHRIVDTNDFETILKNVKMSQEITFAVDITNPQDQSQSVATLVEILNIDNSVFQDFSEIILDPTATSTQTFNWIPEQAGLYTINFFFWEGADIPIALAPVTTLEFEVLSPTDLSSQECNKINLEYVIEGGSVVEACYDKNTVSLTIKIESDSENQITIDIPKQIVYSIANEDCEEDKMMILIDGEVIDPEIVSSKTMNTITIPVQEGAHEIEFIGTVITTIPSPEQYCGIVWGYKTQYLSPRLQMELGMEPKLVKCNQGLELAIKTYDESAICVTSLTKEKLVERNVVNEK